MKIRNIAVIALMTLCTLTGSAVRVHCAEDTVKVAELLRQLAEPGGKVSEKMLPAAKLLIDTPYVETTMADSLGTAQVNMHGFDPMDFVVSVASLATTATGTSQRWRDYGENLVKLGYRKGVDKGFPSKLVYGADWINDNIYRGNVKELTERESNPLFKTKSLDYVTRHRSDYKALADSATYEDMKMTEMGFRLYKIPHLRKEDLNNKELLSEMRDGDIIMLLSKEPDIDIYEAGIIEMKDGVPYLIYASKADGKVVEMSEPLLRFAKREVKRMYGFRWLRMVD